EAEAARDEFDAELAGIAERFPENFSAFSARSAFQIGLRALCFPRALQSRHRARWGPRPPETISTPSSPRSRSVFPKISRRSLRARRFNSGAAPSASPARSRAGTGGGGG